MEPSEERRAGVRCDKRVRQRYYTHGLHNDCEINWGQFPALRPTKRGPPPPSLCDQAWTGPLPFPPRRITGGAAGRRVQPPLQDRKHGTWFPPLGARAPGGKGLCFVFNLFLNLLIARSTNA